jgi:hypothetical protein
MNFPLLPHRIDTQPVKPPYADDNDRSRHLHNMERLAEETGLPVQELAPLYEEVLAGFNSRARIHDYVPILVSKNIKDLLRRH